jgi:hypothetical protein
MGHKPQDNHHGAAERSVEIFGVRSEPQFLHQPIHIESRENEA